MERQEPKMGQDMAVERLERVCQGQFLAAPAIRSFARELDGARRQVEAFLREQLAQAPCPPFARDLEHGVAVPNRCRFESWR